MPTAILQCDAGLTLDQRRRLARGLTQAVVENLGVTPEQVTALIEEWDGEHAAKAGILQVDRQGASTAISLARITLECVAGRTLDQKRKVVSGLTQAVVDGLGLSPDQVTIAIQESTRENSAKGGFLRSDLAAGSKK